MKPFLELKRQLFHITLGIVMMAGYAYDILSWKVFLSIFLVGSLVYALLRKMKSEILSSLIQNFDRKDQFIPGWGAFTFVLGFVFASALFYKNIALAAMGIMVFGDGISTLVGVYFGSHKLPHDRKKSWEGSIAGLFAALLVALIFVDFWLAMWASLVGIVVESLKKQHPLLDDNLLMPLFCGVTMLLLQIILY